MVDEKQSSGAQTAEAIRREAAALFAAHGYEATSLRHVAANVGIKVGSLYNHIDSKENLLLQIMGDTIDDLAVLRDADLEGVSDPVDRLIICVKRHIRFHAERAQEVFIGNTDLRSLSDEARQKIVLKRREYQRSIEELIEAVSETGQAHVLDAKLHAYVIVAQGTHVASWYRPTGRYSLDEIIQVNTKIILRGLGVVDADARVDALLEPVSA
jgi:AcrR family transcriptional regulator